MIEERLGSVTLGSPPRSTVPPLVLRFAGALENASRRIQTGWTYFRQVVECGGKRVRERDAALGKGERRSGPMFGASQSAVATPFCRRTP